MKKILISLLFLVAAVASFAQIDSINYPARKMPFGNWDFIWTNGTLTDTVKVYPEKGGIGLDTLFFGNTKQWTAWQPGTSDTGFVKTTGDIIYNKLILESPNDTMLSVRGGGMNVINGSVLFSGTTGTTPASGAGTRLMWIPSKAAFRAGNVDDVQWDDFNIGYYTFSVGSNSYSTASNSFSAGEGCLSSGSYSVSMGGGNTSSGTGSFCVGELSYASGAPSFTLGSECNSSENYSLAIGRFVTSSGGASSAFNIGTNANSFALSVFGLYNDTSLSTSKLVIVSTDPLFQIGNGVNNGTRNNAFQILKNGKTFIGDSSNTTDAILIVDPTDSTSTFIGTVSVEKSLQVGNDTTAASATNVGAIRYRSDANNSYCEMVMQTGASSYAWVVIKQNTW